LVLEPYIGCSGWSYDGWKGSFYYPQDLDNRYWLSYYSQVFDFVEIDSTFYINSIAMVKVLKRVIKYMTLIHTKVV